MKDIRGRKTNVVSFGSPEVEWKKSSQEKGGFAVVIAEATTAR